MPSPARAAYDAWAPEYAARFQNNLANDAQSVRGLARLCAAAAPLSGPIVDLGCGPGTAVAHLTNNPTNNNPTNNNPMSNGANSQAVIGIDISEGQLRQATTAFPNLPFACADLGGLPFAPQSLGGLVSRYSIIHHDPATLNPTFAEWFSMLQPAAPLWLGFFGSRQPETHGTPFDHTVTTAYELDPTTVASLLADAGFIDIDVETTPIPAGGRPYDHATLLAHKPASH